MGRVKLPDLEQRTGSGTLTAVTGTVRVVDAGDLSTPITVYSARTGGTTTAGTSTIDGGQVAGWVDAGADTALYVTPAGQAEQGPFYFVAPGAAVGSNPTIKTMDASAAQIVHAHRGAGGFVGRDNSLSAMEMTAARTHPIYMDGGDPQRLPDGTWVCSHDDTMDRVLSTTGNVANNSYASWKRRTIDATAAYMVGPTNNFFGWKAAFMGPASETPPTVAQVLERFGGRVCMDFGMKLPQAGLTDVQAVDDFCKLVARYGCQASVGVGVGTDAAQVAMAKSYGIGNVSVGADTEAQYTTAQIIATGADSFSPRFDSRTWTDGFLQTIANAGMKVFPWYTPRRSVSDAWRLRPGVKYVISDDPLYAFRHVAAYTTDQFAQGIYLPGMIPADGFTRAYPNPDGSGWMVFDAQGAGQWMLLGHMADEAASVPTQWTYTMRVDALGSDTTRWAGSILWAPDDRNQFFNVNANLVTGYVFAFNPGTGEMWAVRKDGTGAQVNIGPGTTFLSAAVTAGMSVPLKVELVNSSGTQTTAGDRFKYTRVDTGHTFTTSVDNTYRGKYAHIGKTTVLAGSSGKLNVSYGSITRV